MKDEELVGTVSGYPVCSGSDWFLGGVKTYNQRDWTTEKAAPALLWFVRG